MRVSYVAEGTPFKGRKQTSDRFCTGTPMQEKELDWILDYCKNVLKPGGGKHQDGVIFPVLKNTLGERCNRATTTRSAPLITNVPLLVM